MSVNAIRKTPRVVAHLLLAVALTFLVVGVAAASFLGVTLALQGWATTAPPVFPVSSQP